MNPIKKWSCSAYHATLHDAMTASEYITAFSFITDKLQEITNATSNILTDPFRTIPTMTEKAREAFLDAVANKPTGVTRYPYIFPTRINRTPSSRSGTGLSKVTVTYCRIPDLNKPKPYVKLSSTGV